MDLVAGIVNMKSKELHVLKLGDHHTALFTHDLQAEDTTLLAMALMVPNQYLIRLRGDKGAGGGNHPDLLCRSGGPGGMIRFPSGSIPSGRRKTQGGAPWMR